MDILKTTMDKLTPIAAVRDGLEERIQEHKNRDKESLAAVAPSSSSGSDAEGSAVGNFIGLKPPEQKRKAGRATTSRDKPPYDDRGAKSKKYKRPPIAQDVERCGTSKYTSVVYAREPGHKSNTRPQRGDLPRKERKKAQCSNYGVGGHRRNTCSCSKPKVVLHVVETIALETNFP
ncbi:hypothetical protein ACQJBY_050697 [Aegilops geniculata]